jgi:glycosyltransferase involved in cell wall biosynthesis
VTGPPVVLHVAAVEYTATRLLLPQLRALRVRGYDARLACAPDGDGFDPALAPFQPLRLHFPRSPRPLAMAGACRQLIRILNLVRPDVLHLHTPAAALPVRMLPRRAMPAGTRVVYTVHGFAHVWDARGWQDRALERVERALAPRTDLLLFQSEEDLAQTRAHGYRTELGYLGNGVEESWFAIPPRPCPARPMRLLFVGRLIREKGVLDLFDALAAVPAVRLTVAGAQLPSDRDGVEAELRQRAASPPLAGRVRFTGLVDKAEMQALVAGADALVLPSYREGVPRSLIEGFAAGRPAVATDVRGCRELVEDGVTGFLVAPGRPDRLAEGLRAMAGCTDERYRELSAAAAALAAGRYRESVVFDRLAAAYGALGVPPGSSAPLGAGIVGDDLGRGQLPITAPAEEEQRRGAVAGVVGGDPAVREPEPEQRGPGHPAGERRAGQPAHDVLGGPQQDGPGPGHRTGIELAEPAEQVAVAAGGEPGEVVPARVDLLQERGLGVDEPVRPQHPVDLGDHPGRIEDVFQHGLYDDRVEAAVGQRDRMGVGDELGEVAAVQVEADDVDPARVELLDAVAEAAAADDENPGGPAEQHQQPPHVGPGDPVRRLPDAPD